MKSFYRVLQRCDVDPVLLHTGELLLSCSLRWHRGSCTSPWLHSAPFFMQDAEKEKLPSPLLPFCSQHGWLKASKPIRFIASCAKWCCPSPGHMGIPGASHSHMASAGAQWPPAPPLERGRKMNRACFVLLKCHHRGIINSFHWLSSIPIFRASLQLALPGTEETSRTFLQENHCHAWLLPSSANYQAMQTQHMSLHSSKSKPS